MHTDDLSMIKITHYVDRTNPTDQELMADVALTRVVLKFEGTLANVAAYALGAREACLSCTTNLDAAIDPDVPASYELGRLHHMPAE